MTVKPDARQRADEIRDLHMRGVATVAQLAMRYDLSRATVRLILSGEVHAPRSIRERKQLLRRKRIRARRPTPRRSGRVRDRERLLWTKTKPCYLARVMPELGCCRISASLGFFVVEADHMGERPKGRKASDFTAVPMCMQAHLWRTSHSGPFKNWTKWERRVWCDEAIGITQLQWDADQAAKQETATY